MKLMMSSSSSSPVSVLPPVPLPALGGPLLSVSRRPSGRPPSQHVSSDHPLVDAAAAASAGVQDVVLEDGQDGGVGAESEGAAAERERGRPAADGEERGGRGRSADGLLQLDRGLPAETPARSAARQQQTPPRKTAEERPRQQPHVHTLPLHTGQFIEKYSDTLLQLKYKTSKIPVLKV